MFQFRRSKRLLFATVGTAALLSGGAGWIIWLLGQAPAFYHQLDTVAARELRSRSKKFLRTSSRLWNQIQNQDSWASIIRQDQLNAWLAGDFSTKHGDVLPNGALRPQLEFNRDRVSLAFRLERWPVPMVISLVGRAWVPRSNMLLFEIDQVRAGKIPLPADCVVGPLSRTARSAGMNIEWKRRKANLVAVFYLAGLETSRRGIELERLQLQPGLLLVSGRSKAPEPSDHGSRDGPLATSRAVSGVSKRKDQLPEPSVRR